MAVNWKNGNGVTIFRHDVIVNFFWRCLVSLIKFSYWSKFHVNIITDSGVMTISLYKGLTRNQEFGNTSVWVLPNVWRLARVRNTKLTRTSVIRCYWMLQNSRIAAFTVSELLRLTFVTIFIIEVCVCLILDEKEQFKDRVRQSL